MSNSSGSVISSSGYTLTIHVSTRFVVGLEHATSSAFVIEIEISI